MRSPARLALLGQAHPGRRAASPPMAEEQIQKVSANLPLASTELTRSAGGGRIFRAGDRHHARRRVVRKNRAQSQNQLVLAATAQDDRARRARRDPPAAPDEQPRSHSASDRVQLGSADLIGDDSELFALGGKLSHGGQEIPAAKSVDPARAQHEAQPPAAAIARSPPSLLRP